MGLGHEQLGPGTLVSIKLKSLAAWNLVSAFTSEVMKSKRELGWEGKDRSSLGSLQLEYYPKQPAALESQKGCG